MHNPHFDEILSHIETLDIIDTHEHIPVEADAGKTPDVLEEWLMHYFFCDLVSAGMSQKDMAAVRDPKRPLPERWAMVSDAWRAAENTGYGQSLAAAAQGLYGIERISADTIVELDSRIKARRAKPGYYDWALKEKSKISLCIRDGSHGDDRLGPKEPIVFAIQPTPLITAQQYSWMRGIGEWMNMEVHSLTDWLEVCRRWMDKQFVPAGRNVCLKIAMAYQRSLRFDKVTFADAEREFNRMFEDRHLPDWRMGTGPNPVLEDYLMHHFCKLADDRRMTVQIHTGIQEGNGNCVADTNPVHLTNLFLEYRNVKFDLFHMGYPYIMELGTLAKNFPNVFIDMCWGHIISPEAARRALVEWLDVVPANKISAFGGDYCFADGVYGHQYIARRNVAASLARKVSDRTFSLARAFELSDWLFVDNPKRLFGLDRFLTA